MVPFVESSVSVNVGRFQRKSRNINSPSNVTTEWLNKKKKNLNNETWREKFGEKESKRCLCIRFRYFSIITLFYQIIKFVYACAYWVCFYSTWWIQCSKFCGFFLSRLCLPINGIMHICWSDNFIFVMVFFLLFLFSLIFSFYLLHSFCSFQWSDVVLFYYVRCIQYSNLNFIFQEKGEKYVDELPAP